jgi:hypothetical protein
MTFAAALPWTDYALVDRSLGTEAEGLREELKDAATPASVDRKGDIITRLLEAVVQAAEQEETSMSLDAFNKTFDFLTSLSTELPLPVVVVESEDEVGLDWDEGPEKVVSLTIDDSDRIGFAALFGRDPIYGKAECTDGPPETVRYLLARLYQSAPLR